MFGLTIGIGLGGQQIAIGGGGGGSPAVLTFGGVDTAPDPDVMSLSLDQPATVYWLVDNTASHTGAQIKAGGGLASGNFAAPGGTVSQSIDLSSLEGQTVQMHIVAENANGFSNVIDTTISVQDTTAPILSGMSVGSITQTSADLTAQLNEDGAIWAMTVPAGDPAPSVATIKAAGSVSVTAGTPGTVSVTGLSAGTSYTPYFYGEDGAGNGTPVTASTNFTTTSAASVTYVNQATNNVNVRAPALNANAESSVWTVAAMINLSLANSSFGYMVNGGGSSIRIYGDGRVRLVLKNGSGTVVMNTTVSTGVAFNSGLHHLLIVADNTKSKAKVFVDGVEKGAPSLSGAVKFDGATDGPDLFATTANGAPIKATQLSQVFLDPAAHVDLDGASEATDVAKFFTGGAPVFNLPVGALVLGEDMTLADWNAGANRGTAGSLVTVKPAGGFV